MNSFLRDYIEDERVNAKDCAVSIKTRTGEIRVPIKHHSYVGLHEYEDKIFFNDKEVSFDEFILKFSHEFSYSDSFHERVFKSRNNLKCIIRTNWKVDINDYLTSEKKLLLGHPLHPYPKCKEGMDEDDLQKYSPEFKGEYHLKWIEVDQELIYSPLSMDQLRAEIRKLIEFDLPFYKIKDNVLPLPYHPWQINQFKETDYNYRELGYGINSYSALSSMRSIYNKNSPLLMKYSLSVRLTNSLRHLNVQESLRGHGIYNLQKKLKPVESENFSLLQEPFFVGLKDKTGKCQEESIIQFRENFSKTFQSDSSYLLSTLCEENIQTGYARLFEFLDLKNENKDEVFVSVYWWFKSFLDNVTTPLFRLAFREGILLGAHMQNLIVTLENGLPRAVVFRDCQGTAYAQSIIERKKLESTIEQDHLVLNESEVNKVFGYYVVINTIFSTISALSRKSTEVEKRLLYQLRSYLFNISNEFEEKSFFDYLLNSKTFEQKGNMRCSLKNLNENTTDNPWGIYNEIESPFNQLRLPDTKTGDLYTSPISNNRTLKLRVLKESDLELFHKWHHQEYVSEFWELNKSRDELLDYMKNVIKSPYQLPVMIEVDNNPIGYFELYWAIEDRIMPYCVAGEFDRGLHLLFGEKKVLRTRIVYDAIFHLCKYVFESDSRTDCIWGEPRIDNKKILSVANKLPGWREIKEFSFPHKRSMLICCSREDFLKDELYGS